ncbi:MAG: redoxin domain-containing protein [Planctomycetota bacterium]
MKPSSSSGQSEVSSVSGSTASLPSSTLPAAMPDPSEIVFKDSVQSNVPIPEGLEGLVFFDTQGNRVSLQGYLGEKNVVLVFTEGFAGGMLCPFCKTQTSRLVANYDKFAELDTEVLVVYPGARDHLDEFIEAATSTEKTQVQQIPFPLVLDEDLSAVSYFKIASNLAHPSTFIIDKQGNVRLAYVGVDMTPDRPSIASMLALLSSVEEP